MKHKGSKGEQKIAYLLDIHGIKYKREYIFSDLKGLKNVPLRYDFAVFKGNQLYCLIDYDGEGHFQYIPHFHKNICGFAKAKEWDRRKNNYCLKNNIPLIRVPYWDYDIITLESILTNPKYRVVSQYHNDNLIYGGNF